MGGLTKLFESGRIGKTEIRNRLVMAPVTTYSAGFDSGITDRIIDYFVARAKGGVGLIIPGAFFFTPECAAPHLFTIHDDKFIPGLRKLCDAIHEHGAKIAIQLGHPGIGLPRIWQGYEAPPNIEAVGPSVIPCIPWGTTPRELSKKEIKGIVNAMSEAAHRVKESGADAVEVHAAHGYMIGAFFSPFKNRRTDEYGGSIENRARFACECLAQTRQKVGADFPIIFRFNGSDFLEGGTTLESTLQMAPMFVEAGADAFDITAGTRETPWWDDAIYFRPDGLLVPLAEAIKKVVNIPVITVGKIGDPQFAEKILQDGKADFIAMGRALLADPELPNKAKKERFDDIRRCIYCNNCRRGLFDREKLKKEGRVLSCTVNPELLREREFILKSALSTKKVMVIGGGIAGMEAARVLAQRGHQVFLYEKESGLGGQWNIACSQAEKEGFKRALDYLLRGLKKSGAKVILNKEVTVGFVKGEKPDAVVLASGSRPATLNVPGVNGKNVIQAIDIFAGKAQVVGDAIAVIGGRLRGMEVAHMLAQQGKRVSIITMNRLGENGSPLERNVYFEIRQRLIDDRVTIYALSRVVEIRENGVYTDCDRELTFVPADTVVLAVGAKPENRLLNELKEIVPEIYAIGDCVQPRYAKEAINEGAEIGRLI